MSMIPTRTPPREKSHRRRPDTHRLTVSPARHRDAARASPRRTVRSLHAFKRAARASRAVKHRLYSRGTFDFVVSFGASRGLEKPRPFEAPCELRFLYCARGRQLAAAESLNLAGPTGLEPAPSGTGRRANRLNYDRGQWNSDYPPRDGSIPRTLSCPEDSCPWRWLSSDLAVDSTDH